MLGSDTEGEEEKVSPPGISENGGHDVEEEEDDGATLEICIDGMDQANFRKPKFRLTRREQQQEDDGLLYEQDSEGGWRMKEDNEEQEEGDAEEEDEEGDAEEEEEEEEGPPSSPMATIEETVAWIESHPQDNDGIIDLDK